MMQKRRQEVEYVKKLKADVNNLTSQLSGVQFSYSDPERDFQRSRVKGVVARLVHVNDSSAMTALEVRNFSFSHFLVHFNACLKPHRNLH